jgi:two-component system, cell cycle response regulator CpdR
MSRNSFIKRAAREPSPVSSGTGATAGRPAQDTMANILLAEDDDAMRQFLSTALSRDGHKVSCHRDGQQALAALDKHYDLLIADIVMPGLDGIELARRARASDPRLRVMFITGFAAVALEDGKPVVPGATVLSKPFHLRDLVTQVKQLLTPA